MMWKFFIALFAVTSSRAQEAPMNPGIKPLSPQEIEEFSKFLEKTSAIENADKGLTVPADDDAWLNSGKFEGDILLDNDQRQKIAAIVGKTGRAVATNLARLWPNNTIPYRIRRSDFHPSQVSAIKKVLNHLSTETCLIFQDVTRIKVKDVIIIGGEYHGCFADLGKRGGKQIVNFDNTHSVGRGCFRFGALAHEIFHALGFFHTQARMDRDDYVKIQWENIKEGKENNFKKYVERHTSLGGKDLFQYDYDSIMHYSRRAFSKNMRDTIVPLQNTTSVIGQREYIYKWDITKLNAVYCNDAIQSSESSE